MPGNVQAPELAGCDELGRNALFSLGPFDPGSSALGCGGNGGSFDRKWRELVCSPHEILGMVGIDSEIGKKKGFAARLIASAVRFYGHENSINLCEGLGIFRLQNPTLLGSIVFVEDAQTDAPA